MQRYARRTLCRRRGCCRDFRFRSFLCGRPRRAAMPGAEIKARQLDAARSLRRRDTNEATFTYSRDAFKIPLPHFLLMLMRCCINSIFHARRAGRFRSLDTGHDMLGFIG